MTNIISTARRFFLSAAAFGLATVSLAGAASASPTVTATASLRVGADVDVRDHRTPTRYERRDRYEPRQTRTIFVDPYVRAFARYDVNHNRRIDSYERKSYWGYMLSIGTYGQLSDDETSRFIQLIGYYDLDANGRLIGSERAGMDKLIDSLRMFKRLDRNGDRVLSAYEVSFSMFSPRFYAMDRNHDRVLSQQEVRDEALRAFRAGECG